MARPKRPVERALTEFELRERIADLDNIAAGREFSDEERQDWNDLNAQMDEYTKRRKRLRELSTRRSNTEDESTYQRLARADNVPSGLSETRDKALHAIDRHAGTLGTKAAERLEAVVEEDIHGPEMGMTARYIAAVADPDYNSAFGKLLAEPMSAHLRWTPGEHEAMQRVNQVQSQQRALATLTNSAGGYAIPFELDPTIMLTSDGSINPFRQISRVETVVGNVWKGVSSAGITASFDQEGTEVSDDTPTLVQPTANVEMARGFVPFSIEVGDDWSTMRQEMARLFSDAKDTLEASKFATGVGHGSYEPEGILTGATAIVTTATTAIYALADCYSLVQALPPRFQGRAKVVGHPTTFDQTYRFVGGGSTEPPVMPSREGAYLGRLKYESSAYPSTTTTSGSTILTVGDWSNFLIADRIGLNVEVVSHLFGGSGRPTGQRGLFAYWRTTSKCLNTQAFKSLKVR